MSEFVRIELVPLGASFEVERGAPLQDCLFAHGVEFPCGGRGRCRGCRVRVVEGSLPVSSEEARLLAPAEIERGWRLACRHRAEGPLKLEIAQWEAAVLADSTPFKFTPGEGLGIAIDLGTTTLVAQMLDLRTAAVLGVEAALNPQAAHGSDVMSRVSYAALKRGQKKLEELIRRKLGAMVAKLLDASGADPSALRDVAIVGNSVMHHLFSGIDVEPLSRFPFESPRPGLAEFSARELGWDAAGDARVRFLPCIASFVGSDILAGILATRIHESPDLAILVDLGTNGEIVVGNREGLLASSTAAGPAFEGARISMGMRAATGAITRVEVAPEGLRCHVLGGGEPRGICGSGLVDAVAAGLETGAIGPDGRIAGGAGFWELCPPVGLNQADVREVQLAKGAIAAGIRILLRRRGASSQEVKVLYLAGAFGNYVSRRSARRIGLLEFPVEKIRPSGNTALLGAKIALFDRRATEGGFAGVLSKIRHIGLSSDPLFEETYVEHMRFPGKWGQS
ncbi:MAG: ASKHA domain-containing protein [Planctomycetota bacterium]